MQQQTYSTIAAASAVNVNPTTIQRAIQRGELEATRRGSSKQARFRITADALAAWAATNDLTIRTANGHQVDPATGEVLESAQLGPVVVVEGEVVPMPAAPAVSNVAAVVLPPAASIAADRLSLLAQLVKAGHFEAAQLVLGAWGL
jgi:excisionase family DNA binding protein